MEEQGPAGPSLAVGRSIEITIEKLVESGAGLGRIDGRVVFVSGSLPGESVRARIVAVKKSFAAATAEQVLAPSPNRVAPPCPVFGNCGGCGWQHLRYPSQLEEKIHILREDLSRIGRIHDADILPPIPASDPLEYRTRVQLKTDLSKTPPEIGFHASGTHRIVPFDRCLIASPPINGAISMLRSVFSEHKNGPKRISDIHLHQSGARGKLQIRMFGKQEKRNTVEGLFTRLGNAMPDLVSQVYYGGSRQRLVWKRDYLLEEYKGARFRISDRSFAQINWLQTGPLIDAAIRFADLSGSESVLELYCGVGTFGLFLGQKARELVGCDDNPHAIKDAIYNAGRMGLTQSRFLRKSAGGMIREMALEGRTFDLIVLDPPREGADRGILESLGKLSPSKIVYVSCHAATLARDLRILVDAGFRVGRLQPVDLFPQTHHFEIVAELTR